MSVKFSELQCKEVICICDGRRLGFITDVVVEVPDGQICAIIVPGPCRLFGVLGKQEALDSGTVKSRISRGRKQLRNFLLKSGNFSPPASSKKTGREG